MCAAPARVHEKPDTANTPFDPIAPSHPSARGTTTTKP